MFIDLYWLSLVCQLGFYTNYFEVVKIFIFSIIFSFIIFLLLMLSYLFGPRLNDFEKISAYECGFEPFSNARLKFDIQFYLVAILFLLFDLEVIYLFPWIYTLGYITIEGFWVMIGFLVILIIGFLYEWCIGALDW